MGDIRRAFDAANAGDLEQAVRLCRRILAGTPDDARALARLSHAMLEAGRAEEAEALAAFALVEMPGQPDLLRLQGQALAAMGSHADALELLIEATQQRLVFPLAHAALCDVLARHGDATPRFDVAIITPSIGGPHLAQAIASVQAQTYPLLEHFVVVDGPEHRAAVEAQLTAEPRHPIRVLVLPQNVGAGGFNGHRAYAAAAYLTNSRFVAFLDEDNWLEPDHVESLMSRITAEGLEWAYALRNVVDDQGRFVARDNCESLGRWPTWDDASKHLVDVNCYLLRRDLAIAVSPLWYRRTPDEVSPDFLICARLLRDYPRFATSGRYTVNYRAGMTEHSVRDEYFRHGNQVMAGRYGEAFPWCATAAP